MGEKTLTKGPRGPAQRVAKGLQVEDVPILRVLGVGLGGVLREVEELEDELIARLDVHPALAYGLEEPLVRGHGRVLVEPLSVDMGGEFIGTR